MQWYAAIIDEEQSMRTKVRLVIGQNVKRIRDDVQRMNGADLPDPSNELGVKLSASGVSEVETATRKLGPDELHIIAIALNASIIDMLTPKDGSRLTVPENVEPLPPSSLEGWLRGETPWPATSDRAVQDDHFKTASEERKQRHRTETRTELQEITALRSTLTGATAGPSDFNQAEDAEVVAQYLCGQVDRVATYVNLLADRLEKQGYAQG
jgi:hypothetical protein